MSFACSNEKSDGWGSIKAAGKRAKSEGVRDRMSEKKQRFQSENQTVSCMRSQPIMTCKLDINKVR